MSISDGWMDGVERIPGGWSNLGATTGVFDGGMWPKFIVNHIMQGYQRTMIDWANERPARTQVAVHFTIGRDGRIVQHYPIWNPSMHVAWAGFNTKSVGIEHEGFSQDPIVYGYDYIYSAARPWPPAMVEASIRVNKWVMEAIRTYDASVVPGPATIIGHSETGQPDRTNDPGAIWLSAVKPQILAAFAPPVPMITLTQADFDTAIEAARADGFRAGRREMWEAWQREDTRMTAEHLAFVASRPTAWSI